MPSLQDVVFCATVALAICGCVGWPLACRLVSERRQALALAPALGWSTFAALALPILGAVGFSRIHVAVLCAVAVVGGAAALYRMPPSAVDGPAVPLGAFAMAALLAALPALGVWPKLSDGGLTLALPMFDHSKVAIVDDVARLGLPPGNPFFGGAEASPALAYYYLWHFSAALFAALPGIGGWAADIALTWFTAFASLSLMMGLAVRTSRRRVAAPLVVILSLGASLGLVLRTAFTRDFLAHVLSQAQAPQAWIFQASWAPQHLASACCVLLAVLILSRLNWPLVPLLGITVAAGFESSAWVGGVIFAGAALAIGAAMLVSAKGARGRLDLLAKAGVAVVVAAVIAYPFLRDELTTTAARHLGLPISLHPFSVLGPFVPGAIRGILDLPAYWAVLLVIALPAIYLTGGAVMLAALAEQGKPPAERRLVVGLALLAGISFGIPWLFASTIANNDLGWRGVLPGILVLTIFAAAGLSRWLAAAPGRAIAAAACLVLGIPGGLAIVAGNAVGWKTSSAPAFAEAPELWEAVRRHTAPDERVASNPLLFADTVQWPVNISWALFADRRSCFAGWNLARPFVPLPEPELDRLETLFDRVFAGAGVPQDVAEIATRYDCRVAVVTARDGAWRHDPFADQPEFPLVEARAGKWRIYRIADAPREQR